jgi:superfamily II DNA or RNA helicase
MEKELKKLSKYAILKRKGYIIYKKNIKTDLLLYIQDILTVTPKVHKDYARGVKSFPIFFENKKKLFLPPYWAFENIGQPAKILIKDGLSFNEELKTVYGPRDYQEPIIKKVLSQLLDIKGGIITIPCGAGKTYLAIHLATLLKQKTLIVVHTSILLTQWIERLNEFIPNAKVGVIKGKKFEVEGNDFVIAMLQTLISETRGYDYKTFIDFGITIVDEVHHIAAPSFSRALPIIATKYTIGLSATPERNDKLENVFYWHLGPRAWYDRENKNTDTIVKVINYIEENFKEKRMWNGGYSLPKMVTQIIENKKRNYFIIKQIKYFSSFGRQIIILSTRRLHLETLKDLFDKNTIIHKNLINLFSIKYNINNPKITDNINSFLNNNVTSGFYMGGMKINQLEISSKCNVIFATYQLVSEGTDIPTLNTLIMTSPKKQVEQVIGRIQRGKTGFKPLVIDMCDMFSVYVNQGKFRQRHYRKQKYNIEYIDYNSKSKKFPNISGKEIKNIKKSRKKKVQEVNLKDCLILSD